jgi:hypothetical protein
MIVPKLDPVSVVVMNNAPHQTHGGTQYFYWLNWRIVFQAKQRRC